MATIGGQTVFTMRGPRPKPQTQSYLDVTRPNVDGHELVEIGLRADRTTLTCEVDTNSPSSLTTTMQAMEGTTVTIVTPENISITDVLVYSVKLTESRRFVAAVGGVNGGVWMLTYQFEIQPMGLT